VTLLVAVGNAKALWYLTRGTGAVALLLLTAGVVLGVTTSTRWRSTRWPRFLVTGLHRNVTLLGLAFVVVHVVTTYADGFAPIRLWDAVIPFVSAYRPIWLGLGAVAFDLLLAVIVTSLLRKRIGARTWRAVHWLGYAAWPVALVHALGTGTDPRSVWLAALAVASSGAVVAAVLWRAIAARGGVPTIRVGAAVAALAVPIGVLVWARSGPLQSGWAARAGTPSRLLRTSSASGTVPTSTRQLAAAPAAPIATLPSGSFTASLEGRISETSGGSGLVVVTIDATASGGFDGRVHLALRGVPVDGGGVQMTDSVVALLPTGAPAWYSGRVVGLAGSQVQADVRGPAGRTIRALLALRIDSSAHAVTGTLHARTLANQRGSN
jgi:methionine sulfoxide reductase heme-binding subunit